MTIIVEYLFLQQDRSIKISQDLPTQLLNNNRKAEWWTFVVRDSHKESIMIMIIVVHRKNLYIMVGIIMLLTPASIKILSVHRSTFIN